MKSLQNYTPSIEYTQRSNADDGMTIALIIVIIVLVLVAIGFITWIINAALKMKNTEPVTAETQPAPSSNLPEKSGGGFLKFLGVIFLILLIAGGIVGIAKCAVNQSSDEKINTDGNPILLTRSATLNDFTLTESVEATISNLKESYILIPNVDIKNLEITFKYYDSSKNLVVTKTKNVGNVVKSSQYTISIEHSLSELFKIDSLSYSVTGGTVSYFN